MIERKSRIITNSDAGKRLDLYCVEFLNEITRSRISNLIKDGNILVNGLPVKGGFKIKSDDIVDIVIPDPQETDIKPENIPIEILYENKEFLVVNKPAGMVVHPAAGNYTGTLVNALLYQIKDLSGIGGKLKPGIVHRLDKDTSGLLLVAKSDRAHVNLAEQIKTKEVIRLYKTIVIGNVSEDEGSLSFPIGRNPFDRKKMAVVYKNSREARTDFKVLERIGKFTFARMQLFTGRTHQIRVHLMHYGFPVLGDPVYNGRKKPHKIINKDELDLWRKLLKIIPRQALHAYHLEFTDPTDKKLKTIESPIPSDFEETSNTIKSFYQ